MSDQKTKIKLTARQGDLVDVGNTGEQWINAPYIYVLDKESFVGSYTTPRHLVIDPISGVAYSYDEVRPHNPNQELTLEDGTVLSIPPKKIEKLKKEFVKKSKSTNVL